MRHIRTGADLADDAPTPDDAPITAVLEQVVAAWNRGDIDVLLDAYWKDDAVRYASGSQVVHGFAAVKRRFQEAYPDLGAPLDPNWVSKRF